MTSRTRYAEFSGDAADLRLMLEKAKTSATRKDEHGLARMVFEGVDLAPDDMAQMKRIAALGDVWWHSEAWGSAHWY